MTDLHLKFNKPIPQSAHADSSLPQREPLEMKKHDITVAYDGLTLEA